MSGELDTSWVEERAQSMLAEVEPWVWDGERLPVPIDDIVESWFLLRIHEVDDLTEAPGCPDLEEGQSLSGLLLPERSEIWVNRAEAREWPGRRRFTIAHELGHWRLHRTAQQSLFCRKASVDPERTGELPGHGAPMVSDAGAEARPVEVTHGAETKPADGTQATRPPLPPAESEANAFAAAFLMPAELIEHHYHATGKDFERMCALFGSSRAAMGRRLHQVI